MTLFRTRSRARLSPRGIATRAAVAAAAGVVAAPLATGTAAADDHVSTPAGEDRIGTSVEASRAGGDAASDAILAHDAGYPDALVSGALAAQAGAPLLYTDGEQVDDRVLDELDRLGTQRVWVLGGEAAISAEVADELAAAGLDVERIAGPTRFETAAAVATAAHDEADQVAITLGVNSGGRAGWPDAAAAASLAATDAQIPTLLSTYDEVPDVTLDALDDLGAEEVYLIGGGAVLAGDVADQLADAGYEVERLAGANRAETSTAVAEWVLDTYDGERNAVVVDGSVQPDAFTAGGLAARSGGVVLLTDRVSLPEPVAELLRRDRITAANVVGGTVHDHVLASVQAALDGEELPEPPEELTADAEADEVEADEAEAAEADEPETGPEVVDVITGTASWYGDKFAGNHTANGEIYDPNALTAAHRSLPFNTWVRVTFDATGQSVNVRINDRGPFVDGRVIDLSRRAAEEIGLRPHGIGQVTIEVLDGQP